MSERREDLAVLANDAVRMPLEAGLRALKRRIGRDLGGSGSLLDVGCGSGLLRGAAGRRPWTGFDADAASLRRARRRAQQPGDQFVLGDATRLPFPNDSFDDVFCHGLLHHLDAADAEAALAECARVCRGRMLIVDPVRDGAPPWRKVLYALDGGDWIRESAEVLELAGRVARVERHELFRSGVNRKLALLAQPR